MIEVIKEGIVLQTTTSKFENEGVLNPGVIKLAGVIHLCYRAVGTGNHSTIGYCQFESPLKMSHRHDTPLLSPEFDYESQGLEDPRIVCVEGLYYLTYTAFDGVNALGALATTKDLIHFERHGIIVPQITFDDFSMLAGSEGEINVKYARYNNHERADKLNGTRVLLWDKNLIFFPRRIDGKLHFIHRIKPDIQIASVSEISELNKEYWEDYITHLPEHIVMAPRFDHEVSYIGGGCPPIETTAGWLLIYHGVHDTLEGYVYSACAALLKLDEPEVEIARLPYPLFKPELEWERKGEVNNVCFPTGAVVVAERLYIYYGAADALIACASLNLSDLLKELITYPITR